MPSLTPVSFGAHVVGAGFLHDLPLFALADGRFVVGETGADQVTTQAHGDAILAVAVSADGKWAVTVGDDGRVMRHGAGEARLVAEKKNKWIDQVAIGPQEAVAFASGRTAWVALANGSVLEFPHEKAVGGVAFLPKGLRLATATTDKACLLWVNAKGNPVDLPWKGAHTGITVSPDGRFVVTTMQEPALHGWRVEDVKHMRMTGYPVKVKSISWSTKGKYLATSGAGAAILWPFITKDGPMGKAPLQLGATAQTVVRVACHPAEEVVAIGYDDGLVLAVRFSDNAEVVLRRPDKDPLSALAWDRDGGRLAFGTEGGAAGVIDIRS
ncbi:MAG: WD40 repeat domain-containing protein [Ancalomicrobiaceae bacterium]|nr:WD40 repeat domain-containing protein [Ancalomicrobiaceae bacterium]